MLDYLTGWNEILWQIYPDYRPSGESNLLGGTVAIDQAYIMQMVLAAYESTGVALDLAGVAHALSVDETRIIEHASAATSVSGTQGTDFIVMGAGNQTYRGGSGAAAANDNIDAWREATFRFAG